MNRPGLVLLACVRLQRGPSADVECVCGCALSTYQLWVHYSTRLLLTLEFELDAWTRGGVAPGLALLTFGIVGAGRRHL